MKKEAFYLFGFKVQATEIEGVLVLILKSGCMCMLRSSLTSKSFKWADTVASATFNPHISKKNKAE